jgi:hypothetical protein
MATNSLFFVLPRSLLPLSGLCAPPEDSTGSPGTRDSRRGGHGLHPSPSGRGAPGLKILHQASPAFLMAEALCVPHGSRR